MIRGRLRRAAAERRRFRPGLAGLLGFAAVLAGCTPGVPDPPPPDKGSLAQDCAVSTLPAPVLPAVAGDESFPANYEESRGRFRADCGMLEAKGGVVCRQYPLTVKGDPDLTIDTAYAARAGNRNLLVLQSGLHGVEAFAGAAVQRRIMADRLETILDRGFDVLFIHAVNPYGFKYLRRVDACNIDLNRNFSADGSIYTMPNPPYERLRSLTEDPDPVHSVTLDSLDASIRTLAFVLGGMGSTAFSQGTHGGQYVNPPGFEFGGKRAEPQSAFLRSLLTPLIAAHAGRIYFLDLHTGLGPAGKLSVFSGRDWKEDKNPGGKPLSYYELARFVDTVKEPTIIATSARGSAFETFGDVIDFVPKLAPDGAVVAMTLEWGTLGDSVTAELASNNRMMLEHRAHFRGCRTGEVCQEVKRNFVDLFDPSDARFRRQVPIQAWAFIDALTRTTPDFRIPQ